MNLLIALETIEDMREYKAETPNDVDLLTQIINNYNILNEYSCDIRFTRRLIAWTEEAIDKYQTSHSHVHPEFQTVKLAMNNYLEKMSKGGLKK